MTLASDAEFVRQTLLEEHSGDLEEAYRDLSLRFAYVIPHVSWGGLRAPPDAGGDIVRAVGNVVELRSATEAKEPVAGANVSLLP